MEQEKDSRKNSSSMDRTDKTPSGPKKWVVLRSLGGATQAKKPQVYKFDKPRIVLGSVVSADVHLTGKGVAPIHAVMEIDFTGSNSLPTCTLFDLASESGIFINGNKSITQVLKPGDQINIGWHQLVFSIEDTQKSENTRKGEGRMLYVDPEEDLKPLLLEEEREVIPVFDFRPSSKKAVEVVMSWKGTILSVEHFTKKNEITIGTTRKSDFGIPSLLASDPFPFLSQDGGGHRIQFDSKMKGVVQKSGQLDEVKPGQGMSLGEQDFAKVSLADIDFYVSFTAAPPRLKMSKVIGRDRFFFGTFAIFLLVSGLLMAALMRIKLPETVEPEQVPERIATILYQPEKFIQPPPPKPEPKPEPKPKPKPEPKPEPEPEPPPQKKPEKVTKITVEPAKPPEVKKPLPKVMDVNAPAKPTPPKPKPAPVAAKPAPAPAPVPPPKAPARAAEAKEGEGARAKGVEGTRGEKNAPKSAVKVTEIARPSPGAGDHGASGASQVSEIGNVDILKGAGGRIQNILGNSAAQLGEGSKSLKGFGNFSTRGSGGLALSGQGQGGGGTAETTLGGLGKKGTGMGRVGTGKGAAGNGVGIVGSQMRVDLRSDAPEETVVMGSIDRNAIAEAIEAHKDEFRYCYEKELNAEHPHISGQIQTSFVIGSSGRVSQAGLDSSSIKNVNLERCVLGVLKKIEFPMPRGGGTVQVRKLFSFNMAGRG